MPTARRSSWNPLTEPRRWKPTAPQGCCCCGDGDRPILRASAVASDLRRLVGCARCSAVTESLGPRCLHDHRPPMSQRAIGAQVDLHHDTAGQIGEAAAEVLGVAKRVYRLVLGVKYDVRGQ